MKRIKLFEEFVNEIRTSQTSGTKAGWVSNLENRKYELKREVTGARIGDFINVKLPKGTIIYNLPGGVFAEHFSLKQKYTSSYSTQAPQWNNKYGVMIKKDPEVLQAIENNAKILESQVLNEWGSSDQNIMNKAIHKDAGSPKKMPSPFDEKLRAAAEDAVDFYWDDWEEYQTDKDSLIDNAVRSYLRSYFKKDFDRLTKMFESVNEGNHDAMLDKLADIIKGVSFMNVGKELKKNGIKYSFSTSMIPMYKIDKLPIAIVNKKYAAGAEREVGDLAIGLLESINEEATEVTPDSKVIVDDYMLDDAETEIKSTEIIGAIVSSESEDEFLDYFYKTYGNTAFTENDISTLIAYYQEYREEVNAEETEKEQEEEDAAKGEDAKDPLADLGI